MVGYGGNGDAPPRPGVAVGLAQGVEQIGGSFDQITGRGQVQVCGRAMPPETQPEFARFGLGSVEPHSGGWRVVRGELAGCRRAVGSFGQSRKTGSEAGFKRFGRKAAGTQKRGGRIKPKNGGFDANRAGAAIDDGGDATGQPRQNMVGPCRADAAAGIGRRCGDGSAEGAQEGLRDGVGGDAHRDAGQPRRNQRRQSGMGAQRQHQRKGAGPECLGDRSGVIIKNRQGFGGRQIRNMDNQRIETGAALGFKYPRHGPVRPGIAAKTVDGFGGEGDQITGAQKHHSAVQVVGRWSEGFGQDQPVLFVTQRSGWFGFDLAARIARWSTLWPHVHMCCGHVCQDA